LARRLRPRRLRVSAGSARCALAPAACSSSTMKRQPAVASTAASTGSPSKRDRKRLKLSQSAGRIRPRRTSPVWVSSASKVICSRCTSSPTTIVIEASSRSVFAINAAMTALELYSSQRTDRSTCDLSQGLGGGVIWRRRQTLRARRRFEAADGFLGGLAFGAFVVDVLAGFWVARTSGVSRFAGVNCERGLEHGRPAVTLDPSVLGECDGPRRPSAA
jgi:hypothetical protein